MTKTAARGTAEVVLDRQRASQTASPVELEQLPPMLLDHVDAAVRVGGSESGDKALKRVRSTGGLLKLRPGDVLATFGRAEIRWATDYGHVWRRRAKLEDLLSFARQVVGRDEDGQLAIRHAGHPGAGPVMPLWVEAEELSLTVQPGDVVLRVTDVPIKVI